MLYPIILNYANIQNWCKLVISSDTIIIKFELNLIKATDTNAQGNSYVSYTFYNLPIFFKIYF